jgi:heat shock protein HtpX
MGNQIKTTMLLTVLTLLIVMAGRVIGGQGGMMIALVLAGGMNFFSYFYSDKMVLKMYRAQEVTRNEAPQLWDMVQELSSRAGLPMPKVCIIPQQAPNAFATGRNPEHGVVAVTQGLMDLMSPEEVRGVLAHELGHIKNRDILIGTVAATMAGAIMMLASMARWAAIFGGGRSDEEGGSGIVGLIVMSIIAPMAAMLVQMAISRSREYLADATAAQITGNPEGLAGALEKLGAASSRIPMNAEPATAHMFITNPLSGRSMANLFSTHPPIEERVARLRGAKPRSTGSAPKNNGGSTNPWDNIRGK